MRVVWLAVHTAEGQRGEVERVAAAKVGVAWAVVGGAVLAVGLAAHTVLLLAEAAEKQAGVVRVAAETVVVAVAVEVTVEVA